VSEIIVRFPDFPTMPSLSTLTTGEGYWLVDLPGWWDGIASRNEDDPRPDADGDFDQDPVYGDARYPIVIGRVRFDDEAALFAARKPLAMIAATREPFTIEVESLDGIRRATVVRNGRLGWDMRKAPYYIEFELPLKAADPRKYGPASIVSTGVPVAGGGVQDPVIDPFTEIGGGNPGRATVTNNGTTDTIVSLRVSGGGMSGGVELTRIETAEKLRLEWPILATDVVAFSPGDGQVWLNDQSPIAGYLTIADWWTLGPGETATIQFAALGSVTGTPTLTVECRDADE
jgi:hypothetical protein